MTNDERIKKAAAGFPETFGLWAFPGRRFAINERASYVRDGEVMLYVYTEAGLAFSKGTVEELRREVT